MQYSARTVPLILLIMAALMTTAGAGDREVHKLKFDGDQGLVTIVLDSEQTGVELSSLQPGESQTVTAASGQMVTVTRLEETFQLDVEGQRFEIPASLGPHGRHFSPHPQAGLTIISAEPMDDSKRETISAALAAAGITDEVRFHSAGEGFTHQVMMRTDGDADSEHVIVRKRVEVEEH